MGATAGMTEVARPVRGRALVLIAGEDTYHDLIEAGGMLRTTAMAAGLEAHLGVGLQRFREPGPETSSADVVVLYSFGGLFPTAEQEALAALVHGGRGLVAVHCANVLGTDGERLDPADQPMFELLGSRFERHPPTVSGRHRIEIVRDHPVTEGVEGFETTDEYYELELADDAIEPLAHRQPVEGERHPAASVPVMYARQVGRGRVAYLALGHDARAWRVPGFQALLGGAIEWAAAGAREVYGTWSGV
jgi:type 1 glutamine amidotransferase